LLNQKLEFSPCNSYTINVDQENRNYYNYGGFRHLARNCRNKGTGGRIRKGRRLEYGNRMDREG